METTLSFTVISTLLGSVSASGAPSAHVVSESSSIQLARGRIATHNSGSSGVVLRLSRSRPSASLPAFLVRRRLRCASSSDPSFGPGGRDGGAAGNGGEGGGGGGGEGYGGADSGDANPKPPAVATAPDEAWASSPDVIVLYVGGMTCGGCAAKVKKILENLPQVSAASVNLTAKTAFVWPVSEAKDTPSWQQELGEVLAKHLTSCGFTSTFRGRQQAV